jgi:two-component system sensor histidine kinase/response regulator
MDRSGIKILVVDDSNTNIVLLEAVLKDQGYTILTAPGVAEALSILDAERPHLILLDLLIPKVDGYQFLGDIKKNESTKDIPVIIVSAVTNPNDVQRSISLGAIDYIEKPINIPVLLSKIKSALSN